MRSWIESNKQRMLTVTKSEDGLLEKPPLKIVPFPEKVRDPALRLSRDGADLIPNSRLYWKNVEEILSSGWSTTMVHMIVLSSSRG